MVAIPLRLPFTPGGRLLLRFKRTARVVPDLSYPPQVLWFPLNGVPHQAAKDIPIFCKHSPALSVFSFTHSGGAVFIKRVGNYFVKIRGVLKLIEQALRNGWAITPQGATDALALVREVLSDPTANPRATMRACKIVMLMESKNIEIEINELLLARVKTMGVELNARLKK